MGFQDIMNIVKSTPIYLIFPCEYSPSSGEMKYFPGMNFECMACQEISRKVDSKIIELMR